MKIDALIRVTLTDADVAMLCTMYADMVNQWRARYRKTTPGNRTALNRLVALELVREVRPGRFSFTEAGLLLARKAVETAATMKEHGVTP